MAAGARVQHVPQGAAALQLDTGTAICTVDLDARTMEAQTFPAWLEGTWLRPLATLAAQRALDCALTLVLPQATSTASLFERDWLRALRRGGLVASLARAGHPDSR